MKTLIWLIVLLPGLVKAQSGSEILVLNLKVKKGSVSASNPVNATRHPGYDNQPHFHPQLPLLYYASFNEDGRSDIRAFNLKTKTTSNITATAEREYSPTVTPDRQFLSCIIQRDNGAQDLGKYPIDGGEPQVLINTLTVGYHVWLDNSHVALFVLGEPQTLHYLQLPTRQDTILASGIGRSLHRIPGERALSFVWKKAENDWRIMRFDSEKNTVSEIAATLPGREDLAWTADGKILMSDGTKLFFYDTRSTGKNWMEAGIPSTPELKGITRLAVNAKGDKLAVVVAE